MRKAFLFVGLEKTGTTAVQLFFQKNANVLAELGYLYPNIKISNKEFCHSALAAEFSPRSTSEYVPRRLPGQKSASRQLSDLVQHNTSLSLVIHSEHLSSRLNKDNVSSFASYLSDEGFVVDVFIYLRDHVSFIRSAYSTSIKSGSTETPSSFIGRALRKHPYFDYCSLIDRWQTSQCIDRVTVFSYNEIVAKGEKSMLLHALTQIGIEKSIDLFDLSIPKNVNKALPPSVLFIGAELNAWINRKYSLDNSKAAKVRVKLLESLSRKNTITTGPFFQKDEIDALIDIYSEDYDYINKMHFDSQQKMKVDSTPVSLGKRPTTLEECINIIIGDAHLDELDS
jgi:hypothetical protein